MLPSYANAASIDSWLSLMSGAILLVDDTLTIHFCNQSCAQWLNGTIDSIKGSNLNDHILGLDISRGGKQTVSLSNDDFTPLFARIESRKDLQGTLIELKSWDQEVKDERLSWTHWNKAIQEVQRTVAELEHCADLNLLFKNAVLLANRILDIDRSAVFLYDEKNKCMNGTWGTSEEGDVVEEFYFHEPITHSSWAPITMNNRDFVASWEDFELRHNQQCVGKGWYAATALFEYDKVHNLEKSEETGSENKLIGWFVCDNLIHGGELTVITRGMISLFASGVANAIDNFSQKGFRLKQQEDNKTNEKCLKNNVKLLEFNAQQSQLLSEVVNDDLHAELKHLLQQPEQQEKIRLYQFTEDLISKLANQCLEKNIYLLNEINHHQMYLTNTTRFEFLLENLLFWAIHCADFFDHPQIIIEYESQVVSIKGNAQLNFDCHGEKDIGDGLKKTPMSFAAMQAVAGLNRQLIKHSNSSDGFELQLIC
jgi:hypothetical protein